MPKSQRRLYDASDPQRLGGLVRTKQELVSGEYVMVKTKDGQCMVKELLYHNNTETSLMSVNADYERLNLPTDSIEQIHYVGGIVPPSKIKL